MSERDREHWYPSLDDPTVLWPSVTTILGATTPRDLTAWAAREAARYAVDHRDSLGRLASGGYADEAIRLASGEHRRIAEKAAAIGRLFHRLAEAHVKGSEPPVCTAEQARAIAPYLETLRRFIAEMQPTYHWAEATVYHDTLLYAGTCDCGVEFARPVPVVVGRRVVDVFPPGTLLCGDYKTGRHVWPEAAPQLVGYGMCTHLNPGDGLGFIVRMPAVAGGVVIHIRPDAYRVHGVLYTQEARAGWAHARHWFDTLRSEIPTIMGCGVRADGIHLDDIGRGGLTTTVRDALALEGVFNLAALERFGVDSFSAIPGVGPATVQRARELLALEGRSWPVSTEQREAVP